jgi:hypothetical protein
VRLVISDKCLGLVEALGKCFPEARWQRCVVHWYRNVMWVVPTGKVREVVALLKAIHAQEDREAARAKGAQVVAKLEAMRLGKAAEVVRAGVAETLGYMAFPREHWTRIRTNNPLERLNREIKRRTRVVGVVPRRRVGAGAGSGPAASHGGHQVGHAALSEHGQAAGRGGRGSGGGRGLTSEAVPARRRPIAGPEPRAGWPRGCRGEMCERLLTLPPKPAL